MNFKHTGVSRWHRVSILIPIVAESVVKTAGTMDRTSSATANSSPVGPSTTVPHRRHESGYMLHSIVLDCKSCSDITVTSVSSFPRNISGKHGAYGVDK